MEACSHCKTVFEGDYYKESTSNLCFCHFTCQKAFHDAIEQTQLNARRRNGGGGGKQRQRRRSSSPKTRSSRSSPSRRSVSNRRTYPHGMGRMYNNFWVAILVMVGATVFVTLTAILLCFPFLDYGTVCGIHAFGHQSMYHNHRIQLF